LHTARDLGETLLRLAQHANDPALAVIAHWALGLTWSLLGALPAARQHLEEAIARYTPAQRRALMFRTGRELLAPIYGWFTEGFDTADLQAAQVLLDALARGDAGGHTHRPRREGAVAAPRVSLSAALWGRFFVPSPSGRGRTGLRG
jgi:hypothetical protein